MKLKMNIKHIMINELMFTPVPYMALVAAFLILSSLMVGGHHLPLAIGLLLLSLQAVGVKYLMVKWLIKHGDYVEAEIIACSDCPMGVVAYRYRRGDIIVTEQQLLPYHHKKRRLGTKVQLIIDKKNTFRKLVADLYLEAG